MPFINKFIVENKEKSNSEIAQLLIDEGFNVDSDIIRNRRNRLKNKYGENFEGYRNSIIDEQASKYGLPPEAVEKVWVKDKNVSVQISARYGISEFHDKFIEELRKIAPKFPKIPRPKINDPHLLVIDPADMHFGKYGAKGEVLHEYNLEIAKTRLKQGCEKIVWEASRYNVDKIVLVMGNDILHIDTPRNTTTKGTPQDTASLWWESYLAAQSSIIEIVKYLVTVADIHVIFCPSNHDFMCGFMLLDSVAQYFHQCPNVSFDNQMLHRKYFRYGKNLLGFSHGDGAKPHEMPLLMATESNDWVDCPHRYIYLHHIHHKKILRFTAGEDYGGIPVEFLRSAAGSDRWTHTNFGGQKMAVEAFVHHPVNGQVGKISHFF